MVGIPLLLLDGICIGFGASGAIVYPQETKIMTVIVRAFNKDGYYKDLVIMDARQVWKHENRVIDGAPGSGMSGLVGVGVAIDPEDFPEMTRFEIVVTKD